MENTLITLAHEICKANFMDYPDYDEELTLTLSDALTILVMENVPHDSDIESDSLYEFISNKVKKDLVV